MYRYVSPSHAPWPGLDDDAARRILEAALRDRCERRSKAATKALWLDLSHNCSGAASSVHVNPE